MVDCDAPIAPITSSAIAEVALGGAPLAAVLALAGASSATPADVPRTGTGLPLRRWRSMHAVRRTTRSPVSNPA